MTELTDKHFENFNYILLEIERGKSLRSSLKGLMSSNTFYQIVESNESFKLQYARACEERADKIFDDIILIADDNENDTFIDDNGIKRANIDVIQRSKLMVDTRKWVLSKLNPKKYGDKLNVDQKTELSFPKIDMNEWK